MPPRKLISQEDIITKAYDMTKEKGFESISARSLARELGCSTQPIYASFKDMSELHDTLAQKAMGVMITYILDYKKNNYPELLSKILGYVQYASEEKNLFQLIFSSRVMGISATHNMVQKSSKLEQDMLIYAHGIIMMKLYGSLSDDWNEIKQMIINVYEKLGGKYE